MLFEDLHIGVNNLIGHSGLESYATTCHGWEAELADSVEGRNWDFSQIYLVKTGQGGSTISQWNTTGSYFTTFVTRINAAIALIKATGKTPVPFIWYTQGIIDSIASTPILAWQNATLAHWRNLRNAIGLALSRQPDLFRSLIREEIEGIVQANKSLTL